MTTRRVGVVGLGKMGRPIARHLLAAGHSVHGVDVSEAARAAAADDGVIVGDSVAAMAARTEATLVVVGFDEEVTESCLGPDGVLSGAAPGHVLFICSTVRPKVSIEVGRRAALQDIDVFDATLCRSEHAAIAGELLVLVGGDVPFAPWRPLFEAFASDIVEMGPLGTGQIAKTLNNALLWTSVVANAEVLRMGMRLGIDQATLREALLLSSGSNWALETWLRTRPMPWAEADMEIALELAAEAAVEAPLSGAVGDLIASVKREKAGLDLASASMAEFLSRLEGQGLPD